MRRLLRGARSLQQAPPRQQGQQAYGIDLIDLPAARTAGNLRALPKRLGQPMSAELPLLLLLRWASCRVGRLRHVNERQRFEKASSCAACSKLTGRQSAREPLEEELRPSRALLAASASRCSSWRSVASARGSR